MAAGRSTRSHGGVCAASRVGHVVLGWGPGADWSRGHGLGTTPADPVYTWSILLDRVESRDQANQKHAFRIRSMQRRHTSERDPTFGRANTETDDHLPRLLKRRLRQGAQRARAPLRPARVRPAAHRRHGHPAHGRDGGPRGGSPRATRDRGRQGTLDAQTLGTQPPTAPLTHLAFEHEERPLTPRARRAALQMSVA